MKQKPPSAHTRSANKKRSRNQDQYKEPVVLAVILSQPDIDCPKFPFLKGGLRVEPDQEKIVKNVLALSAEFIQLPLPDYFEILAGQVFYKDQRIEEIRISLRHPPDSGDSESAAWKDWSTPVPPQFGVRADGVPILKPADEGRPYIAGYRIESYFFFSWDVAENAFRKPEKGINLFSLDIPLSSELAGERENDQLWPFNDKIFEEAWHLLSKVPFSHITNVLLPCPFVKRGRTFDIVVDREPGVLSLISDEEYVRRYILARYYAQSAQIPEFQVGEYSHRHLLSSEDAKVNLLLEHLVKRDQFSSEALPTFKVTVMHFLMEQYPALFQQAATRALEEWRQSQEGMKGSVARTQDYLIKSSRKKTREILGLRGSGYPRGKKRTKKREEIEKINQERKKKILKAMRDLYREVYEKTEGEDLAERKVTKQAVSKNLGRSRTTLDNWLYAGGWEFDDLKGEVIRSVQRKT